MLQEDDIKKYFTRRDGQFVFARWGRPIAPVVFGIEDQSKSILKSAIDAVARLAGHEMSEIDPELGSNLMFFFFRNWKELREIPNLELLVPNLDPLTRKLEAKEANQYRLFRFDEAGGIKACFVFLRMDENLSAVSAETLCLSQIVQSILLWSDQAFQSQSPLAVIEGAQTILQPEIAELIRASYAATLPVHSNDPSFSLRLFARLQSQTRVS
mgnify:CR=1 FL=1